MRLRRHSRGFTLIELLIVVAVIGLLAALAIPNMREAIRRSRLKALVADGRTLKTALTGYNIDRQQYPPCCTPPDNALNKQTLFPLTRDGYLHDGRAITSKLAGGQLSAYDSPDRPTENNDFYAVLTHRVDPTLVVLVADTDEYPGHDGEHFDGVYLIKGTQILPPDES